MPPYGELAPSCGTSCSPIPNTTAQATNRIANSSFELGPVIRRAQPWRPPSATIADLAKMNTNSAAIADAARKMTRLFGKSWNQIVKIVTRASLGRWDGRRDAAAGRGRTMLAERDARTGTRDSGARRSVTCYRQAHVSRPAPPIRARSRPEPDTHELRSPRPLRRPPPLVDRRRVGRPPPRRAPVRAPGAAARCPPGGFILDDLESARAKQLLQDGARRWSRRPSSSSTPRTRCTAGDARVAGRRRRGDAGRRRRAARDPDPVPRPRPAPGLAPTATPPTTSSSWTSRPTTRPTRSRPSRRPSREVPGPRASGSPAARRSTATSRRSPRATSGAAS